MCETSPITRIYSQSTAKISTTYLTSALVVIPGTKTVATFTTSACLAPSDGSRASAWTSSLTAGTNTTWSSLLPRSTSVALPRQTTSGTTQGSSNSSGSLGGVESSSSSRPSTSSLWSVLLDDRDTESNITSSQGSFRRSIRENPRSANTSPSRPSFASPSPTGHHASIYHGPETANRANVAHISTDHYTNSVFQDNQGPPNFKRHNYLLDLLGHGDSSEHSDSSDHSDSSNLDLSDNSDRNEDDGACTSWTTITTYSTGSGEPTSTFSTYTVMTTTDVVTSVLVSTVYASCSASPTGMSQPSSNKWTGPNAGSVGLQTTMQASMKPSLAAASPTLSASDTWWETSQAASSSSTESKPEAIWSFVAPSDWSVSAVLRSSEGGNAEVAEVTSSHDWDAASSSSKEEASLSFPLVDSASSQSSSTQTKILGLQTSSIENTWTRLPTPLSVTISASSVAGLEEHPAEQGNATSSKAVSAGAAVGGVVGLLLAIAAILAFIRWWLQRKRIKRTRMMRSSWFYGGDVREEERYDDDENEVRTEQKHRSAGPQSRFSTTSSSAHRDSRMPSYRPSIVPSFLTLGTAFRHSSHRFPSMLPTTGRHSGRFPTMRQDFRKSISGMAGPGRRRQSEWRYTDEIETSPPGLPPLPVKTPQDALASRDDPFADHLNIKELPPVPPLPSSYEAGPRALLSDSVVPASAGYTASGWTAAAPPSGLDPAPRPTLTWGHSYASPFIPPSSLSSQSEEASRQSSKAQTEILSSAALPSPIGHAGSPDSEAEESGSNRGQSHYSNLGTVQSIYSQAESFYLADLPEEIGRAITAPGRTSIEVQGMGGVSYRGSIPFPEPRVHLTSNPSSIPSNQLGRTLTVISQTPSSSASEQHASIQPQTQLGDDGRRERDNSVFEFSSMAGGSEIGARQTQYTHRTSRSAADTEVTGNWYDKSLWDEGTSGRVPASRVPIGGVSDKGKGRHTDERKSRGKSVRWGDEEEEPLPRVFELARAL
ncbi:hypothetical protein BD324DRAFT_648390 [Kockovaella imperatae]|uniref:Uncharacterized protein n=1 Tax=Kockovaella imperatae TaxID=4999 RepID=A0A1Y1UNZ5_9TREE|nr:hypothetical protein BD324DRAFT_648390 [Kockovaella imperatae]ORX39761.1 hypothetical protein BD324DRAFT_648390 [Kockovaella imperatae]